MMTTECVSALVLSAACAGVVAAQQPAAQTPYFDARTHHVGYSGPVGRDLPAERVDDVAIGYFGPPDAQDGSAGGMWQAAQRAIMEANRRGGFHGKPFRLVPAWSENPWGTGVAHLTRLVYQDRVWAVVGGIDGPTTHLAEQVVAKARLPLISPVSSDKTVNMANVPWMFSVAPSDDSMAHALAQVAVRRIGQGEFLLVTANDHDSRLFARELRRSLAGCQLTPSYRFTFDDREEHRPALVQACLDQSPAAIVLIAGPDETAWFARALRQAGFHGLFIGGPCMSRPQFVEAAGAAAEGAIFPRLIGAGHATLEENQPGAYHEPTGQRKSRQPERGLALDDASLQTYDAVCLVTAAICRAGLNRAKIRDALEDLSPWMGRTGRVTWDGLGRNSRPPTLGTIDGGRVIPLPTTSFSARVR